MGKVIWTIEDLKSLAAADLNDDEVLRQIRGMAIDSINTQSFDECRDAYAVLTQKFQEPGVSVYDARRAKEYQDVLTLLRIGQVRIENAASRAPFFKDSILMLMNFGLDPRDVFDIGFIFSDFLGEDDKTLVRRAFEENQEVLGREALIVEGQPSPLRQTVANWLLEYRLIASKKGLENDSYAKAHYISTSKNYGKLSENDKVLLQKVLDFYIWTQKPSLIPVGVIEREQTPQGATYLQKQTVAVPQAPKRVLPTPPVPPRAPSARQPGFMQTTKVLKPTIPSIRVTEAPISQPPVQSRPIPRIAEEPRPRVQIPDISTELSVAEPRVQQPQSTPSLTKSTFTASPFRQSVPQAQTPAKTAPVARPEPKPQQRPDLIKPVVGPQQPTGAGQTPTTTYKLPTTPPTAPHPTAADRSQITVAPKLAGTPKEMVRPQAVVSRPEVGNRGQQPGTSAAVSGSQQQPVSSTLEALRRIRAEEEKQKQRIQSGAEPQIVPLGGMSDFSVNDALIHAGKGGRLGQTASQGAVAGGEPPEVADRLRKLESKNTQEPKNVRTEETGAGKAPPTFPPPPGTP